jgi:hypothetical protein
MNERIRELADQCEGRTICECGEVGFNFEKFAELIVRECVTIINHGIDHTAYPHPNDTEKSMVEMKAQIWCRDAIKEHFGVEE